MMGIEIKGFDDIFNELDDMNISDKKKRKALKESSGIIKQEIEDNSPKYTGKMKKRWQNKIKRFDGNLGFEIRGDTVQDIYNEFGSSKNKKHIGFFSKAVDRTADKAVDIIVKEILD